jgi:3-methyladenine DNA glycosylase AlkC
MMSNPEHPTRGFSLKDQLYNPAKVAALASDLKGAHPRFDVAGFTDECVSRFPELELKARADWMAEVLARHLPDDFATAADVIRGALPPALDPTKTDDDFGDFIFLPYGLFAARFVTAHRDLALGLIEDLTQRFSMEYPIRSFIAADPMYLQGVLLDWTGHDSYHVRRLASEGSRPLLPWAARLPVTADWGLPILDRLHGDRTRFVTRSVANHLNDVAKTDAEAVLARITTWRGLARQQRAELNWMARHSLRTLVKQGHRTALSVLGFDQDAVVKARMHLPDQVAIGGTLEIAIEVESDQAAELVIDYALHLIKANGKSAAKVFKLKTTSVRAGETMILRKAHRLHAEATTYRLFPGTIRVDLLVNGRVAITNQFELVARR